MWATAYALGVTALAASYHVANNIPNMVYELVAGGILSSLFIPVFLDSLEQRGEEDAWRYASYTFNLTVIVLGLIALAATIWAGAVVRTQTFRTSPEEALLATFFFRVFAVQVLFYGAGAVIAGLLNARRQFLWPALGPVFNNLIVIVTMFVYVYLAPRDPGPANWWLAVGTTLGVLVMFAVQIPSLLKLRPSYSFKIDFSHPGLRAMGRMAIPTMIYVATNMVAISFRNAYAFAVAPEGPATLSYAWMFYQLPYGVLAVALATAIFTELSEAAGKRDLVAFRAQFSRGLRATGMLIIPMAAMLIALAEPLVTLYRAGRFTAEDIPTVTAVLQWWGAGLFFFAAFMYILKSFYSLKDTRTPMLANLALVGLHIGLYALLTTGTTRFAGIGLIGIPIADGVFYGASMLVLAVLLRRKVGGYDIRGITWVTARIMAASALGGLTAWGVSVMLPDTAGQPVRAIGTVLAGGVAGLGVTWLAATLLRVPEVELAASMLRRLVSRLGVRTDAR